jgi:hypothetical protein
MDNLRDWLITFSMIVIRPFPQTFITEAKKAQGKFSSAIVWLVAIVIATHLSSYLVFQRMSHPATILLSILFIPIAFLFFVFCLHRLYQLLFGRKKELYQEFLYLTVGIFVPFILLNLCVSFLPEVGEILSWVTLLYPIVLTFLAVKAITNLRFWQSIVIVLLSLLLATAGFFLIPAFILSLMNAVPRVF